MEEYTVDPQLFENTFNYTLSRFAAFNSKEKKEEIL